MYPVINKYFICSILFIDLEKKFEEIFNYR